MTAPLESTERNEKFYADVALALGEPWWWEASGRSAADWDRQLRTEASNVCPAQIHDQPIFCGLHVGPVDNDGVAYCADRFIAHVLRPTTDPEHPWRDTGRRVCVYDGRAVLA